MRTFLAIPLHNKTKEELSLWLLSKRENICGIKWVKSEQWHITLAFLGDITEEKVNEIINAIDAIKDLFTKFVIEIDQLGEFRRRDGGIIWLGVKNSEELENLALKIDEICRTIIPNIAPMHKPFNAHITIARVKKRNHIIENFIRNFLKENFIPILQDSNRIVLYKSELTRNGPIHTEIRNFFIS